MYAFTALLVCTVVGFFDIGRSQYQENPDQKKVGHHTWRHECCMTLDARGAWQLPAGSGSGGMAVVNGELPQPAAAVVG